MPQNTTSREQKDAPKKAYRKPALKTYGNIHAMTKGQGPGPGGPRAQADSGIEVGQ
jgi:hypothetical protein